MISRECHLVLGAKLSVARGSANSMSMNLRHAAALALVGWYLMAPVVARCVESDRGNKWALKLPPTIKTDYGPEIDLKAPLNQWWGMAKYQSREVCERVRTNWPTDSWTGQQVLHGKCVFIDDSRLNSN